MYQSGCCYSNKRVVFPVKGFSSCRTRGSASALKMDAMEQLSLEDLSQRYFPFVDPTVSRILLAPSLVHHNYNCSLPHNSVREAREITESARFQVTIVPDENGKGRVNIVDTSLSHTAPLTNSTLSSTIAPASMDDLVSLARQCDSLLFANTSSLSSVLWSGVQPFDEPEKNALTFSVLWRWIQSAALQTTSNDGTTGTISTTTTAWCTVALLLALNALESAIRTRIGLDTGTPGKSPLLTTMLRQLTAQAAIHTAESCTLLPIVALLSAILLPTGLNLRNLHWHGFVGAPAVDNDDDHFHRTQRPVLLLRPWLALILMLVHQLEQDQNRLEPTRRALSVPIAKEGGVDGTCASPTNKSPLFRNRPRVNDRQQHWIANVIVPHGTALRLALGEPSHRRWIQNLIPPSHVTLWDFCQGQMTRADTMKPMPMVVAVVLTVLLEHGLRLMWCRCNGRPLDTVARPGTFYVTLDGHGQRHQHDTILHPLVHDGGDRNDGLVGESADSSKLVPFLGGGTMALLVDMFVSGAGGPNIRAALAHGTWDAQMAQELMDATTTAPLSRDEMLCGDAQWHVVDTLLVMMEQVAHAAAAQGSTSTNMALEYQTVEWSYRPIFSFTSTTLDSCRELSLALQHLTELLDTLGMVHDQDGSTSECSPLLQSALLPMVLEHLNRLEAKLCGSLPTLSTHDATDASKQLSDGWSPEHLWQEHGLNRVLEPLAATRLLLAEVSVAVSSFATCIQPATRLVLSTGEDGGRHECELPSQSSFSSRERKRLKRLVGSGNVVLEFYTFASLVATLHLRAAMGGSFLTINQTCAPAPPSLLDVCNVTEQDLATAVERTRMVVSTVSTFIVENSQRAFKAIEQYTKGKIVKKITHQLEHFRLENNSTVQQ
jgi:Domain of unknown function (DUF4209)